MKTEHKSSLITTILGTLGYIALYPITLWGLLLVATSAVPGDVTPLPNSLNTTAFVLFCYLIFCEFYLWTLCVVKNGTLIVLDGKVLLPGTEFRLHPLIKYKLAIVDREIKVNGSLRITCLDGDYNVQYHSSIHIEIEKMSLHSTPTLDPEKLIRHAEDWVSYVLHRSAKHTTLGKFLTEPSESQSTELDGVPVSWDGKKNLVFMQRGAMHVEQL